MTNMDAALEYAQRGWPTFPVHFAVSRGKCSCGKADCQSPAKHPMTKAGLKDATTDAKQIKEWWGKNPQANIGIVTGPDSGLVVVDIDPRHGGMDSLKAITKLGSLPVMTPTVATGGGGEHIYLAYPNNGTRIKNTAALAGYDGIDLRGDGGYVIAPPSKHISGGRYTWKVKHIGKAPARMPDWFVELANSRRATLAFSPENALKVDKNTLCSSIALITEGSRDEHLFNLAKTLKKGGMAPEDITNYLLLFAERCCNPPFPAREALAKIQSTFSIERNLSALIKSWIPLINSQFTVKECDSELSIVNEREKALRRQVFHQLVQSGEIERMPNKPGVYRPKNRTLEEIVMTDTEEQPLDIKWPFGLENLVDIGPKNIVIVAGSKDAGKTAFCLNTALLNMKKWDIRYFSSEMGQHEFKRRLRRFEGLSPSDWRMKAYLRSRDFGDVIFPEALNIIDYLEISQDFSMVAEQVREIYDKLTTGIALIALQKDPKANLGRGASFSLEKSRMYLTLDRDKHSNILTIVSGKNWHQEGHNPAGKQIKYNLINGAKLKEVPF